MQKLSISIQQRIKKTKQVIENSLGSETIRSLREEEKIRCEKENFILVMMRGNKIISPAVKKSYLLVSYQMMSLLQPSFSHKLVAKTDEDFLNDFVHLYTSFFHYFEDKFTFKTKIKNFLRPTNIKHNLIVDLIKYFVDFTRDYYVQTLFWKMRNSSKNQNVTVLFEDALLENGDEGNLIKSKPLGSICKNVSCLSDLGDGTISPRKKTDQNQQKRNNQRNYDILQVSIPLVTMINPKQHSANIQSLKIKVNELFREQKSRNGSIKRIYEDYFVVYNQKFNKLQNQTFPVPYLSNLKRSDHLNVKCYPLKLLLSIQKYGFSMILLQVENKRGKNSYFPPSSKLYGSSNNTSLSNSPIKLSSQNSLSPLKITQRISQGQEPPKGDYFLTSMKVLRVSQNFLPPLITSNTLLNNSQSNSRKEARQKLLNNDRQRQKSQSTLVPFSLKLRKMTNDIEQHVPLINELSNSTSVLVRSTSFKNSTNDKEKNRLQKYNNELYSGEYISKKDSSDIRMKRKDSEDSTYRLSNKKIDIKKKLIQQRKSYQNGTFFNMKYNSKPPSSNNYESQQKILQWLQKIKNLKQIERRKILGMNF